MIGQLCLGDFPVSVVRQSIPPVPMPRGQPWRICSGSLSRGWGICAPRRDPREFDTRGFKTVKSTGRRVACFIPWRWRLPWDKMDFTSH